MSWFVANCTVATASEKDEEKNDGLRHSGIMKMEGSVEVLWWIKR